MAFESVDVISLKNSIRACREAINYDTSSGLIGSISNNNVWECASRDNLKKALETLVNNRYKELEKQLDSALAVANLIGEYKNLEQDNIDYKKRISSLKNDLYRNEEKTTKDADGNDKTTTEKVKDESVEQKINSFENRIEVNKDAMEAIVNKVASS